MNEGARASPSPQTCCSVSVADGDSTRLSRAASKRRGKEDRRYDKARARRARASRDGGIRTRDPLNPIQVRYRTALRPGLLGPRNLTHPAAPYNQPNAAIGEAKRGEPESSPRFPLDSVP